MAELIAIENIPDEVMVQAVTLWTDGVNFLDAKALLAACMGRRMVELFRWLHDNWDNGGIASLMIHAYQKTGIAPIVDR